MTSSFTESGASSINMCRRRGQNFIEFRQWKKGASFNMEAVKQQIEKNSIASKTIAGAASPPTFFAAPDKRPGLNFIGEVRRYEVQIGIARSLFRAAN
jgi:hypothetical protein